MQADAKTRKSTKMMKPLKVVLSIIVITGVIFSSYYVLENKKYDSDISQFKTMFGACRYSEAKTYSAKLNANMLFKKSFEKDAADFFKEKLAGIFDAFKSGKLSYDDALKMMDEMSKYDVPGLKVEDVRKDVNKLNASMTAYKKGQALYDEKKYEEAIIELDKVIEKDANYESSKKLKASASDELKKIAEEKERQQKEEEERKKKEEEEKKRKEAEAKKKREEMKRNEEAGGDISAYSSGSDYLAHVSIAEQKTYIYKGSKNNWELVKTFACSTGKPSYDTPKGVYHVCNRGDWFYSSKYQMGAKCWVQFHGNYLFHSFPMDEQGNVLDTTLGAPATHGCVRLGWDDIKWVYSNLSSGTTVVIK